MNSTQQNDANGGTPLAEPTGSQDCYNCDRVTGRIPGMVYCDMHEEWVNDTDVACADFCGANQRGSRGAKGKPWVRAQKAVERHVKPLVRDLVVTL